MELHSWFIVRHSGERQRVPGWFQVSTWNYRDCAFRPSFRQGSVTLRRRFVIHEQVRSKPVSAPASRFRMPCEARECHVMLRKRLVPNLGLDQAAFSAHMTITCFTALSEKGLVANSEKMGMCSAHSPATANTSNLWVT
jgi:hypothetical protein